MFDNINNLYLYYFSKLAFNIAFLNLNVSNINQILKTLYLSH